MAGGGGAEGREEVSRGEEKALAGLAWPLDQPGPVLVPASGVGVQMDGEQPG